MSTPAQPAAPAQPAQPAPAPAAGGHADSETGRIKTIEELSARQDKMDGKLDQLLARLPGAGPAQQQQPAAPASSGPDTGTVQQQMREAIKAVRAEERAAEAAKGQQQPAAPPAEQQPREPGPSLKARWQRAMFGAQQ